MTKEDGWVLNGIKNEQMSVVEWNQGTSQSLELLMSFELMKSAEES